MKADPAVEVYFTSDSHYGHKNIIRYCHRPFGDVDKMDAAMVAAWNARVPPGALVYHLGDFTLGNRATAAKYFPQLHGRIQMFPGSHDERWLLRQFGPVATLHSLDGIPVEILPPLVSLEFPHLSTDGQYPQAIVLCHYALVFGTVLIMGRGTYLATLRAHSDRLANRWTSGWTYTRRH